MARMIEQLLDLARIRTSGLELSLQEADVTGVLAPILEELLGGRNPELVALSTAGDTVATVDPDRLAQIFSNLIGNALQHGDLSSPVAVTVDGSERSHITVRVRNRGSIAPQHMRMLFEPFRSASPTGEGLGLGLYIAKQLVEAHGGQVRAHSDAEYFTTFEVAIPRNALPNQRPARVSL